MEIFFGILIIILSTLRPFAYKKSAITLKPELSNIFTSVCILIGCLFLLPFQLHNLYELNINISLIIGIFGAITKGIMMYFFLSAAQKVNKESTSTFAFIVPIGLMIGAILNFIIFEEPLSIYQLLGIIGIGSIGILFFIIGNAKKISKTAKLAFILDVIFLGIFMVIDNFSIPKTKWYLYTFFCFFTSGTISLFLNKKNINELKKCFKFNILIGGIVFALSEFILISTMIVIIPVSLAMWCVAIGQFLIIILSYFIYKEGKISEQLIFATLALIFSILIAL